MKFEIATITIYAAIFAAAQDGPPADGGPGGGLAGPNAGSDGDLGGPGGPGGPGRGPPPPFLIRKNLVCPTVGGTATVSVPCPTGPPPTGKPSHPHSPPTNLPTGHHQWDGTVTIYPSGAPEVTEILGIDCRAESGGPSCLHFAFASRTCAPPSNIPKPTGLPTDLPSFSARSFPTVTATSGATKTIHAHAPPTCKASGTVGK